MRRPLETEARLEHKNEVVRLANQFGIKKLGLKWQKRWALLDGLAPDNQNRWKFLAALDRLEGVDFFWTNLEILGAKKEDHGLRQDAILKIFRESPNVTVNQLELKETNERIEVTGAIEDSDELLPLMERISMLPGQRDTFSF